MLVILRRKNALFYRTVNGAQVANSSPNLREFKRHAQELAANPAEWMPRDYRATSERSGVSNAE
jgi:hypothetical protein